MTVRTSSSTLKPSGNAKRFTHIMEKVLYNIGAPDVVMHNDVLLAQYGNLGGHLDLNHDALLDPVTLQ